MHLVYPRRGRGVCRGGALDFSLTLWLPNMEDALPHKSQTVKRSLREAVSAERSLNGPVWRVWVHQFSNCTPKIGATSKE